MEYAAKKRKINNLSDEVRELHPLLSELFTKIPSITNMYYTHGNAEFGTDFVLTHFDELLDSEDYIGVIVKSKSITQGALHDVDRQVKECSMPRLIENGKKKIVLSTIWIVTSQNIAQNAKEKINFDYPDKKIKFIDDQKLIKLIDRHLDNYWYDINLKVSTYLNDLRIRAEEEDRSYSLVPGLQGNLYIEQDLVRVINEGYDYKEKRKKKVFEKVDIYREIADKRFILIEGQMGAGKSKLLRHLAIHYSNPDVYLETKIVPIFIQYKLLIEGQLFSVNNIIHNVINNKILSLNGINGYVILIDGFDEVNNSIDENVENLKLLLESHKIDRTCSVIVATRHINILSSQIIDGKHLARVELSSLSAKKMFEFLRKLCNALNIADRLFEDITKSPLMQQLPQSPIAAILLAKLIENNSKDLPSNMPELYQKYLELALGRWDIDKGLESQKEYDVALAITMEIAEYIFENNVDEISCDILLEKINAYLSPRNLNVESRRITNILLERSGVLIKDHDSETIRFTHRTFAEYFYALLKTQTNSLIVDSKIFSVYWMNVYYFYIGIKRDCLNYLQSIIDLVPENESEKWLKIINMANFFMAGYSTPYSIVESNIHKILIDTAMLYSEITVNKTDSVFSSLPEIVLLWWIQYALRSSYSYEYFAKSIDDCVIRIVEAPTVSDEIKSYALFFLSVIGIEQNNRNPLDFLLSDYKHMLPITIQVGLLNEIEKLSDKNDKERRGLKMLNKRLKNVSKKYIDDIFNVSLKLRKIT